jgi:hypothetical protein
VETADPDPSFHNRNRGVNMNKQSVAMKVQQEIESVTPGWFGKSFEFVGEVDEKDYKKPVWKTCGPLRNFLSCAALVKAPGKKSVPAPVDFAPLSPEMLAELQAGRVDAAERHPNAAFDNFTAPSESDLPVASSEDVHLLNAELIA